MQRRRGNAAPLSFGVARFAAHGGFARTLWTQVRAPAKDNGIDAIP
jgi:hypothetical protein